MSENAITRRSFLAGSAGVAAVAAGAGFMSFGAWEQADASGTKDVESHTAYSLCNSCSSKCGFKGYVVDGKLTKMIGEPGHPHCEGTLCGRAYGYASIAYSEDRLTDPLKKNAKGEFEKISWDQAYSEIAEKVKSIIGSDGPEALAMVQDPRPSGSYYTKRFMQALGSANVYTHGAACNMSKNAGFTQVIGAGDYMADVENAKACMFIGRSYADAIRPSQLHALEKAHERGAYIVLVDPRLNNSIAFADEWLPINPGTDLALVLGMAHVIVEEGLENETFLRDKSCAPFLVNQQTGKFLRASDLGLALEGDPAAVFDEARGEIVPVTEAKTPALSGDRSHDGLELRTAWDMLRDELAKYPPERVEELTDVAANTVVELAHLQAGELVSNLHGFGNGCYVNGGVFGHALATLASITGNIGKSGCSFGFPVHVGVAVNDAWLRADLAKIPGGIPTLVLPEVIATGKFHGEDFPIKALHFSNSNALSNTVNHNVLREQVLPNIELIVTQDVTFNDTVRYSDIVLPTPNYYEEEELVALFFAQHPYMQHSDKAVDPLFEAKSDTEILRLLADAMGIGDQFMPMSDEEACDLLFDTPLGRECGLTFANLKEKGVIKVPGLDIMFEGQKFNTPSDRAEFYVENPAARNDYGQELDVDHAHLPQWEEPAEAWPENPLAKKYPLVVITPKARYRVHGQWFNVPALREMDPEPTTYLNPQDAQARGIADGDYVEVFNDRGGYVARCILSEGIRPGVISTPKGWQRNQHKRGGYQEVTGGHFDPFTVNNSFYETLADVRKWEEE